MKIYILCPANRVTGGVELAHQLCYAINTITDATALMWYSDIDNLTAQTLVMDLDAPRDYSEYKTSCAKDYWEIDREENVVVIPEGLTNRITIIDHAKMVLWWMSVDNYVRSSKEENLEDIKEHISLHLFQSYYSMDYVEKRFPGARGIFLSDYINDDHGKFIYPAEYRQNIALFNPKKGFEELKPLIKKADWIKWVPLEGMSREKMILMLQSGKIYIDFGNHPGKDRIPREAAANGCVVITNRKGAAAYYEDVPISDDYKFENPDKEIDKIDAFMHEICSNFREHQDRFSEYREVIKKEKAKFYDDVITFLEIIDN